MKNYTVHYLEPRETAAIRWHYESLPEDERAEVLRLARQLSLGIRHLGDRTAIEVIYSIIQLARRRGETL